MAIWVKSSFNKAKRVTDRNCHFKFPITLLKFKRLNEQVGYWLVQAKGYVPAGVLSLYEE